MYKRALATLLTFTAISTAAHAETAAEARLRAAATKNLALFQTSQKHWFEVQRCDSCHHQYQPALAYRAAREHGIPFDETIARADAARAFTYADLDKAVQYSWIIEPAVDDAYRLIAADAAGVRPNLTTSVMARLLIARQNRGGDWPSHRQRPPSSYSNVTFTALGLRAIQLYSHPSQRTEMMKHVALARTWLETHRPVDTEERTYQLLGLKWSGADRAALERLSRELFATQEADGGWASLDGRASDAYSTGQALVALHEAGGVPINDAKWQRGIEYLLKTQAADGSWHTATRLYPPAPLSPPYFESGLPYGHDQFLSAQGGAWAVMALGDALGAGKRVVPEPLPGVAPQNVEAWAETMLFGTVADVKKLLDAGLDPNSATKSGGTTALMMAAPDADKMKVLIDRGANVNARSETKYTALMVAAQHGIHSTPAIRLLLAHGADASQSQGRPLFNADPLFLAAYGGNAEVLPDLLKAGASLNGEMTLIGTSNSDAISGAVRHGYLDVAETLVTLGAPVDRTDARITPLVKAVLGDQVEMARFLISKGADVNHVDGNGMTPLLYAASIDFGSPAMIDMLLKAGARTDMTTKQGKTALELARQYKHTHLIPSLERIAAR
ncbi:MAG TPA: ankyrin repeat domain-containing protein [Vicinamibacterales bacterium]|nr:ankyrin repeat domain-containing protein [Vicinamibacterales bacterium]